MRAVGCVRPIDKLGRLVLPADIDNDSIIIKKYRPACIFCKSDENLVEFKNQSVCLNCMEELKK